MRGQGGQGGPPRNNNYHNNLQSVPADHTALSVTGWSASKAASNQDPITSLVGWLERKASPNNGPRRKIHRYQQKGDVLQIEVETAHAERFLHLDGFTFAGAVIYIAQAQNTAQNQGQSQNGGNLGNHRVEQPQNQITSTNRQPAFSSQNSTVANGPSHLGKNTSNVPDSAMASSIQVRNAVFHDVDGVGQKFISEFFPLYDNNRQQAIAQYYDDNSQFSLSIKTRGANSQGRPRIDWSEYIKRSRNLVRLHKPQARAAALHTGQQAIFNEWTQLPKTIHPLFEGEQIHHWLLECMPIHNLPDASCAAGAPGVDGLTITTHGVFEDQGANGTVTRRGFDRTFVLGPAASNSATGIRVISDMLTLRPYSGNSYISFYDHSIPAAAPTAALAVASIDPTRASTPLPPIPLPTAEALAAHPELQPGSEIGQQTPGKTEEQVVKERLCLELSFKTKLTLAMADQALVANSWSLEAALVNVEQLTKSGALGSDAFLNV